MIYYNLDYYERSRCTKRRNDWLHRRNTLTVGQRRYEFEDGVFPDRNRFETQLTGDHACFQVGPGKPIRKDCKTGGRSDGVTKKVFGHDYSDKEVLTEK